MGHDVWKLTRAVERRISCSFKAGMPKLPVNVAATNRGVHYWSNRVPGRLTRFAKGLARPRGVANNAAACDTS